MRTRLFAIAAVLCSALAISACCTSLTCQVKKAAGEELGCDGDDLTITNLTRHEDRQEGLRVLKAEGCGKSGTYNCYPTNAVAPSKDKRRRGHVENEQTALDYHWQCRPVGALTAR